MHLLYNGQLLQEEALRLPLSNRAFQYNDGFFETIVVQDGRLRFWQDHRERILAAARVLKLELPQELTEPGLEPQLLRLAAQNGASGYGRLKLKVWRGGTGLYTPDTDQADWLVTIQPATTPPIVPLRVGICQGLSTSYSPFSFFKGPQALLYVQAGIQKKARGYDDMLLLSTESHVAELISANIFWIKNDTLYTPSLETGCVSGILRHNIWRWCREAGTDLQEAKSPLTALLKAEAAFAANVTGIRQLVHLADTTYQLQHPLTEWLAKRLSEA